MRMYLGALLQMPEPGDCEIRIPHGLVKWVKPSKAVRAPKIRMGLSKGDEFRIW